VRRRPTERFRSLLPLNKAIRNRWRRPGGIPATPSDSATAKNAARVIGMADALGHVRWGRAADLVLVDSGLDVRATIVDGRLVYDAGAAAEAAR